MSKKRKLEINPKTITGRIILLKAMPYKGYMVYLRRIGIELFEYLVVYKGELYTSYWEIKRAKGQKDLTPDQVNNAAALVMGGAVATINMKLGVKLDKKTQKMVDEFEDSRKKMVN